MNSKDLRPASQFAIQYGVKALIYGKPGTGKTPVVNTAPRPVLIACEPGLLSMRGSNVPTWPAFTAQAIDEFFKWLFHSNETSGFDTVAIDSISQMCDIYLQAALKTNKHGLAAYGEMATNVMNHLRPLYYLQQKHAYLICKQETISENNITVIRPYFPGKQLAVDVPHLYDEILQLDIQNVPGQGQVKAFRCKQSFEVVARDRTGQLNEFEPPDFGYIIKKATQ